MSCSVSSWNSLRSKALELADLKERSMKPILSYELASAAGMDAGNRSMRQAGRKKWNEDDFNAAARETNRLIDVIEGRSK